MLAHAFVFFIGVMAYQCQLQVVYSQPARGTINRLSLETPPEITSTPVMNAFINEIYSYDVEATGDPSPVFDLTMWPEGMTIDATSGLIEWMPSELGRYGVVLGASNGVAPADSQAFVIQVGSRAPIIISVPDTAASVDEAYVYEVEAAGTPAPIFGLLEKPDGMTIDSMSGRIEWTPLELVDANVLVVASNEYPPADSQRYHITVTGTAPTIISLPQRVHTRAHLYNYDVEATGSPSPIFALSSAPSGMALDPSTGEIMWTPAVAGTFEVIVLAVNGVEPAAVQNYTLTIVDNVGNEAAGDLPGSFELMPSYPNPFTVATEIVYHLPEPGIVSIVVYDVLGRVVQSLVNAGRPAGKHRFVWRPGDEMTDGVYYISVSTHRGDERVITAIINR